MLDHFLNQTTTWFTGVSVVPSVLLLTACLPLTFWPSIKKDIERTFGHVDLPRPNHPPLAFHESLDDRIGAIRLAVNQIQPATCVSEEENVNSKSSSGDVHDYHSKRIRDRIPFAIAYASFGLLLAAIQKWDDPWMLQITALAVISSLLSSCPTVRIAVLFSFLVGIAIAVAGWVFNDVPMVPARDAWVRCIGNCVFAAVYWWLLIGLVKLFVQQWRLRSLLRDGTKFIDLDCETLNDARVDSTQRSASKAKLMLADKVLRETQSVSTIISRDLFQLSFVGLIICFARMPWFDAWGMSLATWLTIVFPMAAPFVSSIFLRRRGFEFRGACSRYQSELAFQATTHGANIDGSPDARDSKAERKEIEEYSKLLSDWQARFKSYDRGVFSPLDRDPLVSTGISLLLALSSGPQGDLLKRIATFLFI